jgi:hypothetical protein
MFLIGETHSHLVSFKPRTFPFTLFFVVTAHNNDEQYIESKRERSRERDTDLTWFGNLLTSTERRLLF